MRVPAYDVPGGFAIGEDVRVTVASGLVCAGRVQGAENPGYIRVMMSNGVSHIVRPGAVVRDAPAHSSTLGKAVAHAVADARARH